MAKRTRNRIEIEAILSAIHTLKEGILAYSVT
jgi:hypothetical protein